LRSTGAAETHVVEDEDERRSDRANTRVQDLVTEKVAGEGEDGSTATDESTTGHEHALVGGEGTDESSSKEDNAADVTVGCSGLVTKGGGKGKEKANLAILRPR
jgi:hypothetical protein